MKTIVYSILIYFPLIFIYKWQGNYHNNYWVNYYWLVSSLFFMIIFLSISKLLSGHIFEKVYRRVILCTAVYWGGMAALRIFLFFRIDLFDKLISSADKLTIGVISIIIIFIYLTAKITCHRK